MWIYLTLCMDMPEEKLVAMRIRREREKVNLSQMELSFKAGLSQNMVQFIETGKRVPTLRTLIKICRALNISPVVLFKDDDQLHQEMKERVIELIRRYL